MYKMSVHCPVCGNASNLTYCPTCAEKFQPPNISPENCDGFLRLPTTQSCAKEHGQKNQHWYHCNDCFPDHPYKGYCITCAKNCQIVGHKIKLQYSAFICDSDK